MRTLYSPSNAVEAQILKDVLAQEGIEAVVLGAHLQGAVGELPAAGLIRLTVDASDFERGRDVIARWESGSLGAIEFEPEAERDDPIPTATAPASAVPTLRRWPAVLLGLLTGVAASTAWFRTPSYDRGYDHNGDGIVDERYFLSSAELLVRVEQDRNFDGKPDLVFRYDSRGRIASSEQDNDFDGRFEGRTTSREGSAEFSEVDTDGDGFHDIQMRYRFGVLRELSYLDPATGRAVRVETMRLGDVAASARVDTDADGALDTLIVYDRLGGAARSERIDPPMPR